MSDHDSEDEVPAAKRKARQQDFQRDHLSKLMANPDKPVSIPEGPKKKQPKEPPEFVRFYMGSSAGAGSEVFHVYRHLRRRENDRQAIIENNAAVEEQDREFQEKRLANKMADDERTSKKRAKRLKKKQKRLERKKQKSEGTGGTNDNTEDIEKAAKKETVASSEEEEDSHFTIGGK